jgi:hypothetical protein
MTTVAFQDRNGEITLFSQEMELKWATDRTLYRMNKAGGEMQFSSVRTKYADGKMPYGFTADEKKAYLASLRLKMLRKMKGG